MTGPQEPRSTVVVVTWRGRDHLARCLDALAGQRPHRLLVVDNASDDGTAEIAAAHPSRPEVLRTSRNLGYAGAMTSALPHVRTPFMAWLNDDAAPEPGWLAVLEEALDAAPGIAAASSSMSTPDGRALSTGVRLTADGHGTDGTRGDHVFGFCGGAALLRTRALNGAGGVPATFFCYYEDTDTSWRLRLTGHRVVSTRARVRHLHGASTRPGSPAFHRWNERNRLLMLVRCAPAGVAARECARFAALTAVLPIRRALGRPVPDAANFRTGLRARVLAEVATRLPAALRARRDAGRRAVIGRRRLWRDWAGRSG